VCEELDLVLFVHPWDMHNWDGRLTKYWMPWLVRPDLCATDCAESPRELQHLIWTDSLVHDPTALHLLANTVGKDKIVLGTDYPFPLGELEVGKVVEDYDGYSNEDKDHLLWRNAIAMLRLDENSLRTQL
ncbi:Amidohydro-rel domain-containing protein, partial [Trichostrongylus colubriformis]